MKRNTRLTFSAMMAALATAFMLLSYFPYLTYAIPAVAGLFIMVVVIEINRKWALGAYIASAILVFLIAEPESKLMYIGFLGYYPIVKAMVDGIRKPVLEWAIKLVVFNVAVIIIYFVFAKAFGISFEDFGTLGKYGALILLAVGNGVFVLYDIAVSRMAMAYMYLLHGRIRKFFK